MLRRYEGLFLFDSAVVRDWHSIEAEVKRLMDRIGAQLQVCVKFDERKLAFDIKRRKRGVYVLTYFDAPTGKIVDLERDARLSEVLLRAMVLRKDLSEEKLAALRSHQPDVALAPAGDGRRHDDHDSGPPRGGRDRRHDDRHAPEPEIAAVADMEDGEPI